MKYKLSEIPELDPAEFYLYRSGKRTSEYFYQRLENDVLDLGHTQGWIPTGKTNHSQILSASAVSCTIAIMYQWKTKPEEMIWFHL